MERQNWTSRRREGGGRTDPGHGRQAEEKRPGVGLPGPRTRKAPATALLLPLLLLLLPATAEAAGRRGASERSARTTKARDADPHVSTTTPPGSRRRSMAESERESVE